MQGEKRQSAKALYEYEATDDTQLSLRVGQKITVIGDATAEGWYLAESKSGQEGYVPKDYIEVTKPAGPPPVPGGTGSTGTGSSLFGGGEKKPKKEKKKKGGYQVSRNNDVDSSGDEDTWGLFAYQLEWFAIPCIFLGATLSFMYSTPQTTANKWRLSVTSWLTLVLAAFLCYICGYDRQKLDCGSAHLMRGLVFLLASFMLAFSYPVGVGSAAVAFITFAVELKVHMVGAKELSPRITDDWCSVIFGGTQNCLPVHFIVVFASLALSTGIFGWGYIDGANFAIDNNEENVSHYLNETANAFMFGFGRVVTINLFLALLLASRDLFDLLTCQKCSQFAKRKGDERHIPETLHRCMGYSIVVSTFLHLICVYFTYEDSMATHTFMDTYGWSSFVTGWIALTCLAVVVAASNEELKSKHRKLWKWATYPCAIVMVGILMMHGGQWLSTYYWKIILFPVICFALHSLIDYCKNHTVESDREREEKKSLRRN